jgi:cytochrome c-type biogenesis protein CcmE
MKPRYIISLVFIAIAMVAVLSIYGKTSTYSDFEACKKDPGKEVHIVGVQVKEKGEVYDPKINPNYFSFYIRDQKGVESKVELSDTKPQDFDKAEKVVVVGRLDGDVFKAKEILMKCPRKYNNNKVETSAQQPQ